MEPSSFEERYSLEAEVQQGSDAVLYRGVRHADGKPVSVKVLLSRHPPPQQLDRLRRELEIGETLDSPHVLRPYALETLQGRPALVMEDFAGQSLAELLGEPMEIGRLLQLALNIAASLADIHRRGIIHRDVKPQNILVHATTGEVRLTNFGIASRLSREQQSSRDLDFIEGTLAYLAPEQTGRTNRNIDQRSDLYSLGVTLYQMATGSLPFVAEDTLGWIHCHLARTPQPPGELVQALAPIVSDIIMRLLAKTPEDRYQSAGGLIHDLERCLSALRSRGRIRTFRLGERDISPRFQLSQKLYGRAAELAEMLHAVESFENHRRSMLLLVTGSAGIGKSSLVRSFEQAIVGQRGLFVSGKFDQYQADVPYATLLDALRRQVPELLTESEEAIEAWRQRFTAALGQNGQVIVEVIPQIELIIGPQPPLPVLPPREAQNRFVLALRNFVAALTQQRPLFLFLDDLQWADAASLSLLPDLLGRGRPRNLFVIGACRNTDAGPGEPLMSVLDELCRLEVPLATITLEPLGFEDLSQLVADTLRTVVEQVTPLARILEVKTSGNPLFVHEFLVALHEEALIYFDAGANRWRWDLDGIRATGFTANVVDFLVDKLRQLPEPVLDMLQLAACIGNRGDWETLAVLSTRTPAEVRSQLGDSIREGLLLTSEHGYLFLHDRVQQAVHLLMNEQRQQELHLHIGRLLLRQLPPEQNDGRLFEVARHLNTALPLITDPDERLLLMQLNLRAGRRAKATVAYDAARNYFNQAIACLPRDAWHSRFHECFALHRERAECEYLCQSFETADTLFELLLDKARTDLERAEVHQLQLRRYQVAGRYDEAVRTGLEALARFGIHFPATDDALERAAAEERAEIVTLLDGRRIETLVDAPLATDRQAIAIIDLLAEVQPCASISRPSLFPLLCMRTVHLSLKHGNTLASCLAYSAFGVLSIARLGEVPAGFAFSELALQLNERLGGGRIRGTLLLTHGNNVNFWRRHIATDLPLLESAFHASLDVGDLVSASYLAFETIWHLIEKGDPIEQIEHRSQRYAGFARDIGNTAVYETVRLEQHFLMALRGNTERLHQLDDESFEEARYLALVQRTSFGCGAVFYHVIKLILLYLDEHYDEARRAAEAAMAQIDAAMAMPIEATCCFLHALALSALAYEGEPTDELQGVLAKLRRWAEHCPENFLARRLLVEAEVARLEGRELIAMRLYEQAIRAARDSGFVHVEALASDLASRYYRSRGFELIADTYLREARSCYAHWGANGKVRQIDSHYRHLLEERSFAPTATFAVGSDALDMLPVVKASQVISSEILLARLPETLMRILCEQAGADRGCLVQVQAGELGIQAEATVEQSGLQVRTMQGEPQPVRPGDLPVSVVRYVQRTHETVILDDSVHGHLFAADPYVLGRRPKSMLCLPIMRQGQLRGLLYLENNQTVGAFPPDKLSILEMLAAQAAISLENATLYAELETSRAQLQAIIDSTTAVVYVKDTKGKYVLVNRQFEKSFHVSKKEIKDKTDFDIFPAPVAATLRDNDRRVLEAGRPLEWEEVVPHDDGLHTYLSLKFPLRDPSGMLSGVCAVSTDITERKHRELSERFLATASRQLATTLDYETMLNTVVQVAVPELADAALLYIAGESGALRAMAAAAASPGEVARLCALPHDVLVVRKANTWRLDAAAAEPVIGQVDHAAEMDPEVRRLIEALSLRSYLHVPLWTRGRCLGALVLLLDLSGRNFHPQDLSLAEELGRRAAMALDNARLYRDAQEAIRTRDEFLSVASHELRTPCTSLRLAIQGLERYARGGSPAEISPEFWTRAISACERQSRRLNHLINRLLDVSRIRAGRLVLELGRTDLADLVRHVLADLQEEAARSGCAIEVHNATPVIGIWDAERLRQVATNLVSNALKYGANHPVAVNVAMSGDTAVLQVSDHGIGVAPDQQRLIFEPFERAVSARNYGGFGLGLYIVRQIVEAHGGTIGVQSTTGEGSTFTVELPCSSTGRIPSPPAAADKGIGP